MCRKILCILCLFVAALSANAAVGYMTIEKKSGEKFSFMLMEKPVVTFVSGNLVVNGNAQTSYAIAEVRNYHFTENDLTGVANLSSEVFRIATYEDGSLQVQNAAAFSDVSIVNMNGVVVSSARTDATGSASINLSNLKGIYILSVGNQSVKLIRK